MMAGRVLSSFMVLYAVVVARPVFAQSTMVSQHRDWGIYNYQSDSGKACYAVSLPKQKEPASLDHGDIFFVIVQKNDALHEFQPQFEAGYSLQDDSKVTVTVGDGRSFAMHAHKKAAWVLDRAEESQLISVMRSGSDMQIFAMSRRGNKTSYTFSLLGLTAALAAMQDCR